MVLFLSVVRSVTVDCDPWKGGQYCADPVGKVNPKPYKAVQAQQPW